MKQSLLPNYLDLSDVYTSGFGETGWEEYLHMKLPPVKYREIKKESDESDTRVQSPRRE